MFVLLRTLARCSFSARKLSNEEGMLLALSCKHLTSPCSHVGMMGLEIQVEVCMGGFLVNGTGNSGSGLHGWVSCKL